ncbi:hypothetical protein FACS189499_04860 [Clostridia bacterium]|nr:hypothetical protein FACS189499_04860 [Clostridia bacterium]
MKGEHEVEVEDYKPNSHKFKEERKELVSEKKVEKVIVGSAKLKKKSGIQKFSGLFVPEDVTDVKSYIVEDIVIPAIKDILLDTVRTLLGKNGGSDRKSTAAKVSYRNYYDRPNDRRDNSQTRTKTGYGYDDVVLENRGEAEEVLVRMDELISIYGMVSVADLYDLVDITGNYTDNKYGWTDIRSASVIRVRDGYILKLPKALPLN